VDNSRHFFKRSTTVYIVQRRQGNECVLQWLSVLIHHANTHSPDAVHRKIEALLPSWIQHEIVREWKRPEFLTDIDAVGALAECRESGEPSRVCEQCHGWACKLVRDLEGECDGDARNTFVRIRVADQDFDTTSRALLNGQQNEGT